jgi:hypothetical protein
LEVLELGFNNGSTQIFPKLSKNPGANLNLALDHLHTLYLDLEPRSMGWVLTNVRMPALRALGLLDSRYKTKPDNVTRFLFEGLVEYLEHRSNSTIEHLEATRLQLSDQNWSAVLSRFSQLKSLTVHSCDKFGPAAISALQNTPSLDSLFIDHCDNPDISTALLALVQSRSAAGQPLNKLEIAGSGRFIKTVDHESLMEEVGEFEMEFDQEWRTVPSAPEEVVPIAEDALPFQALRSLVFIRSK